jgi:hypothetical protein
MWGVGGDGGSAAAAIPCNTAPHRAIPPPLALALHAVHGNRTDGRGHRAHRHRHGGWHRRPTHHGPPRTRPSQVETCCGRDALLRVRRPSHCGQCCVGTATAADPTDRIPRRSRENVYT